MIGFIPILLLSTAPVILVLALAAVILKYVLRFAFRLMRIPNYTVGSPCGLLSWTRLAPPDILFRLASLAAVNLVLYWLPIYYWTTYTPSGDDRDGGVLFTAMVFCPVSWVLGALYYAQAWRLRRPVSPYYNVRLIVLSSVPLLVILSTVFPVVRFYVGMSQP